MSNAFALVIAALALTGTGMRLEVRLHGEPQLSPEGSIDPAKVRGTISKHMGMLVACFQREALRGAQVDGKLVLTWHIRPDGTMASIRLAPGKSTVRNDFVESCVFRQAMRWRFPAPGHEVTVVQALLARFEEVPAQQRRWVAHSDPTVSFEPSEKSGPAQYEPCRVTSGPLDPDALRRFLRERQQQISSCLTRANAAPEPGPPPDAGSPLSALLNHPSLQAHFKTPRPLPVAGWTVSPEGTSSDVKVTRGSVQQKEAETCLRGILHGWTFPRREAAAAVSCTFLDL